MSLRTYVDWESLERALNLPGDSVSDRERLLPLLVVVATLGAMAYALVERVWWFALVANLIAVAEVFVLPYMVDKFMIKIRTLHGEAVLVGKLKRFKAEAASPPDDTPLLDVTQQQALEGDPLSPAAPPGTI